MSFPIRNTIYLISLLGSLLPWGCSMQTTVMLESPDRQLRVLVETDQPEGPSFSLIYESDTLLTGSELGLIVNGDSMRQFLKLDHISRSSLDETWQGIAIKNSSVRNHYNQMILTFQPEDGSPVSLDMEFRCFNDGIGFRYHILSDENGQAMILNGDLTTFDFPGTVSCWAVNGEDHNLGPLSIAELADNGIDKVQTPCVASTREGKWMAIHEADIHELAYLFLSPDHSGNRFRSIFSPSETVTPSVTSWRTVLVGNRAGDLTESNLLVNLNPQVAMKDFGWVEPGKAVWTWRIIGYRSEDGFEYGTDTESVKRLIDFAELSGIGYILVDSNWYGPEFEKGSNPGSPISKLDIRKVTAYAHRKNVKILLYLNDIAAMQYGLENILSQFYKWGVAGVKYGFMEQEGQEKVKRTQKIIELCAKYKLLVDFHDNPVPPGGTIRTWPNVLTREYGHAQADGKRSYWPETAVTTPFVNLVAGPLDMTNGWFDLNHAQERDKVFEEIPGTVSAELAKIVVIYSGLVVLPDAPEEYLKKWDLFGFIREFPVEFDEYKVLNGQIGEFITVARRSGYQWFIGSLTNREARELDVRLDFLDPDREYVAVVYSDAPDSDYLLNKESYTISEKNVIKGEVIHAKLASGGGQAILIRPVLQTN